MGNRRRARYLADPPPPVSRPLPWHADPTLLFVALPALAWAACAIWGR